MPLTVIMPGFRKRLVAVVVMRLSIVDGRELMAPMLSNSLSLALMMLMVIYLGIRDRVLTSVPDGTGTFPAAGVNYRTF